MTICRHTIPLSAAAITCEEIKALSLPPSPTNVVKTRALAPRNWRALVVSESDPVDWLVKFCMICDERETTSDPEEITRRTIRKLIEFRNANLTLNEGCKLSRKKWC